MHSLQAASMAAATDETAAKAKTAAQFGKRRLSNITQGTEDTRTCNIQHTPHEAGQTRKLNPDQLGTRYLLTCKVHWHPHTRTPLSAHHTHTHTHNTHLYTHDAQDQTQLTARWQQRFYSPCTSFASPLLLHGDNLF